MINSILNSTKKNLGLDADYHEFDDEVLMQINSVFSTLHQLGVGPVNGYAIEDETAEWGEFLQGDFPALNNVRNFMFLSVRLAFDPPDTSFGISAVERLIEQTAWRIEVAANPRPVVRNPDLPYDDTEELPRILDGGAP